MPEVTATEARQTQCGLVLGAGVVRLAVLMFNSGTRTRSRLVQSSIVTSMRPNGLTQQT
jgi:hypothetical protein